MCSLQSDFVYFLLLGCPCPHAVQDKSTQGCLMHSSHFLGITCLFLPQPACMCVCVCVFSCVLTGHASQVITRRVIRYDGLLFLFGHDDPAWHVKKKKKQPCGLTACFCFDVREKYCGRNMSEFHFLASEGRPHLCPPSAAAAACVPGSQFPRHSWSSSLLSCNCSSVLGNRGRKSQSFRRATMTIKRR